MTRPDDRDVAGLLESQLGVRGVVGSLHTLEVRVRRPARPPVDSRHADRPLCTLRCTHRAGPGDAPDPRAPRLPGDFTGECSSAVPSITAQVAGWTAGTSAAGRVGIHLVILDGGANDVRITTIMTPWASDAAATAVCSTAMGALLTTMLATFPSAAVVVTGHHPIVSTESDDPVAGARVRRRCSPRPRHHGGVDRASERAGSAGVRRCHRRHPAHTWACRRR